MKLRQVLCLLSQLKYVKIPLSLLPSLISSNSNTHFKSSIETHNVSPLSSSYFPSISSTPYSQPLPLNTSSQTNVPDTRSTSSNSLNQLLPTHILYFPLCLALIL